MQTSTRTPRNTIYEVYGVCGRFDALLKVHSIKSSTFSLIRLCGNVVYTVEKSYVDKLVARNPLPFNLLNTSPEFFIYQNRFLFEVSYTVSQYLMT